MKNNYSASKKVVTDPVMDRIVKTEDGKLIAAPMTPEQLYYIDHPHEMPTSHIYARLHGSHLRPN